MADPISIIGLVATVGQILASLHVYGTTVKEAWKDISDLNAELFALQGILKYMEKEFPSDQPALAVSLSDESRAIVPEVLKSTKESLESLLKSLEQPKSGFKKALQALKWPLDKDDALKYVTRLERLKTTLVLVFVTGDAVSRKDIHEAVVDLVKQLKEEKIATAIQDDNEKLLRWLAPVSTQKEHARACQIRHPGTGKWFAEGPLVSWSSGLEQYMLCLRGKSGCGKTTLFSLASQTIEERCRADEDVSFAYFYCSFKDALTQEPVNVLGSIAAQLAEQNLSLLDLLRPAYESMRHLPHQPAVAISELERLLCEHFDSLRTVYILVDAVNESDHSNEILESLHRMMYRSPSLRVLVTSTLLIPVWKDRPSLVRTVHLRPNTSHGDIGALVDFTLTSSRNLARLEHNLKSDIREAIIGGANGSFRWVHLCLEHLESQRTGKAVRQALKSLPETLNATYCGILGRIPSTDREMVRKALLWLSFSARPLTLPELNEAVVLEEGDTTIDSESRLYQEDAVLEMCRGLIELNTGYASLAHSSVKTFLSSDWIFSSSVAHFGFRQDQGDRILMHACLQYLSLDNFRSGYCYTHKDLKSRFREYPLLHYAAQFWPDHATAAQFLPDDEAVVMRFLETQKLSHGGNYGVWVQSLILETDVSMIEQTQPLYYAASYGMVSLVAAILRADKRVKVDARGGRYGSTPLFVACWRGHFDVARLLLRAGAKIDRVDSCGHTITTFLSSGSGGRRFGAREFLQEILTLS